MTHGMNGRGLLRPLVWACACMGALGAAATAFAGDAPLPPGVRGPVAVRVTDGVGDDLLTAGLGKTGLMGGTPAYVDPAHPTASELRRNAIYTNYRALVDITPGGGMGVFYGPNIDIHGQDTLGEGKIAGSETLAWADDGSGRRNVTLMVQVPTSFDPTHACIVTATSSGSRGIYGAIATAGEWGLKHGCAVAYTDKGSGNGYHDLMTGLVTSREGLPMDAATAGTEALFISDEKGTAATARRALAQIVGDVELAGVAELLPTLVAALATQKAGETSRLFDLAGYDITATLGEVFGLTVRSRNIGAGCIAGFRSIAGGEIPEFTKLLVQSRNEAMARMVTEAQARGANAVIGAIFGAALGAAAQEQRAQAIPVAGVEPRRVALEADLGPAAIGDRVLDQVGHDLANPQRVSVDAWRQVRRVARAPPLRVRARGEKQLHHAIFKRVKRNNRNAPAGLQRPLSRRKTARQFAEFIVHEHAQRLKRFRRRVRACTFAAAHGIFDNFCQVQRAGDAARGARLHDTARDTAAVVILAIAIDEISERGFAEPVYGISGAQAFLLHTHVQIRIGLEREAALGFVQLEGRDAEVEHDAVDRGHA